MAGALARDVLFTRVGPAQYALSAIIKHRLNLSGTGQEGEQAIKQEGMDVDEQGAQVRAGVPAGVRACASTGVPVEASAGARTCASSSVCVCVRLHCMCLFDAKAVIFTCLPPLCTRSPSAPTSLLHSPLCAHSPLTLAAAGQPRGHG